MFSSHGTLLYPGYREGSGVTGATCGLSTLDTKLLFQIYPKNGVSVTRFWFNIRAFTGSRTLATCKFDLYELVGDVPSGSILDSVTVPVGGFSSLPATFQSQYFYVDFTGGFVLDGTKRYGIVVSSLVTTNYPTIQAAGAPFLSELMWSIGFKTSTNAGSTWSTYFNGLSGYATEYSDGFIFGMSALDGYHQSNSTYGTGFEINALDFNMEVLAVQLYSAYSVANSTCKIFENRNLVAESLPSPKTGTNTLFMFASPVSIKANTRVAVTAKCGIGYTLVTRSDIVFPPPIKTLTGYELGGLSVSLDAGGVLSTVAPTSLYLPSFSLILAYNQKSALNRRQFNNAR